MNSGKDYESLDCNCTSERKYILIKYSDKKVLLLQTGGTS